MFTPKNTSVYAPEIKYDGGDDDNFVFKQYGKAVFRSPEWDPGIRNDVINFDPPNDTATHVSLNVYNGALSTVRSTISKLVKVYYDCVAAEGIKRPILSLDLLLIQTNTRLYVIRNHDMVNARVR